ncbi:hypothetical protein CY658_07910 [Variovorax sp. RO1]|nr:hypothetical protein CY658_07910 [Variovorax sp. RO1]
MTGSSASVGSSGAFSLPFRGRVGWGLAAYQPSAAFHRPLAPIPAFPREGKEQYQHLFVVRVVCRNGTAAPVT